MTDTNLSLPATLKIKYTAEVHEALGPLIDGEGEVLFDGSACDAIDYAGVQLLMVLEEELDKKDRSLKIVDASQVLQDALADLGSANLLSTEA